MKTLHFYFALRSPYSALATDLVLEAAGRAPDTSTIQFRVAPFANLSDKFLDPTSNPLKLQYMLHDLPRLYRARGLELGLPDPFEVDYLPGSKAVLAAQDAGVGVRYLRELALLRWCEGRNIADRDVLLEAARRADLPDAVVVDAIENPIWDSRYQDAVVATEQAGVFGVPFFIVEGPALREPFWGQDRWPMVNELITDA